jgi:hypothetical protein
VKKTGWSGRERTQSASQPPHPRGKSVPLSQNGDLTRHESPSMPAPLTAPRKNTGGTSARSRPHATLAAQNKQCLRAPARTTCAVSVRYCTQYSATHTHNGLHIPFTVSTSGRSSSLPCPRLRRRRTNATFLLLMTTPPSTRCSANCKQNLANRESSQCAGKCASDPHVQRANDTGKPLHRSM